MLLFADRERVVRLMTPPAFAMFAYMLLAGISTLYAKSGKFAIAEFSCMLAAFAGFMMIVLRSRGGKVSFRRTAAVLAAAAAPVGVLSIDAASSNILMRPFRALMEVVGPGYGDTGATFYARLNTIFGNPNVYAGLMSIACLLSLWLVLTAETRKQKILCTILLMVNAVSYLLAFSMGSLGVFVVACLLMLALAPKERRHRLLPAAGADRGGRACGGRGIGRGLRRHGDRIAAAADHADRRLRGSVRARGIRARKGRERARGQGQGADRHHCGHPRADCRISGGGAQPHRAVHLQRGERFPPHRGPVRRGIHPDDGSDRAGQRARRV